MKNKLALHSLGHAALTFLYISGVAWLLSNGQDIFGPDEPKNFWIPATMLLIFVFSATITAALVLGRPLMLYLDGAKKEALKFFGATVGWIFIILLIVIALRPWE